MNKKGITVVEFIVSFALVMTIVVFLMQMILNLTALYNNNDKKTKLLNKQSLISDKINSAFMDKGLIRIDTCTFQNKNCYIFYYSNGESETLSLNNNILQFGNFTSKIDDAVFEDFKLDIIYTPTLIPDEYLPNNSIFILNIPIKSDINYNFDIKVLYQFNSESSSIDEFFTAD